MGIREFYRALHREDYRPGKESFDGKIRGRFLMSRAGQGKRILDLGVRGGEISKYFSGGNKIVGVDIDSDMLRRAREIVGLDVVCADLSENLPFQDSSFDVVVVSEVLEHLFLPKKTIEESHRVLRPGGVLLGSVPNAVYWKVRLKFLLGRLDGFVFSNEHIRPMTLRTLEVNLRSIGFASIEFLGHPVHLPRWGRLGIEIFSRGLLFSGRKGQADAG